MLNNLRWAAAMYVEYQTLQLELRKLLPPELLLAARDEVERLATSTNLSRLDALRTVVDRVQLTGSPVHYPLTPGEPGTMITNVEISELSSPMFSRILSHQAKPNDKIIVLTNSVKRAEAWALQNKVNRAEYFTITAPSQLRGIQTGQYPRIRLEDFHENPNAGSINATLAARDDATRAPSWR